MDNQHLRNQIARMRDSLIEQGVLDALFVELQTDWNPHFAEDTLTLYFSEYVRSTDEIETLLREIPPQFETLDVKIMNVIDSSASVGAAKVLEESRRLWEFCKQGNTEGSLKTLERMKEKYLTLKEELGIYFQLARQVGGDEGGGN